MKKWKIISPQKPKNIEELLDIVLKNRQISKNDKNFFQDFDTKKITPSSVGIDSDQIKKAKKRIEKSLKNNEQIVVFGDYDADGICATTILWETLYNRSLKTSDKKDRVMPYLPDRKEEGYGISKLAIDNLLKKYPETKLIITVDNGILAHDAVEYAKEKNIDVIISDHHTSGEKYPDALAVVYTQNLCGAGVAWMIAKEISPEDGEKNIDLVAIAAVADLVPLTNANRTLVKKGLEQLNQTQRLGLKELISEARIQNRKIGVYDIGFMIAPRINAAGRVGHAIESLRLLCTNSNDNARIFAAKLGAQNRRRQIITENLTDHAKKAMAKDALEKKILIAQHTTYDEGVVGLIASKLVETYYLPSLAISQGNEISKGSARSISGINIIEMIHVADKYLEGAGGHPMAAGFVLKTKNLEDFKKTLQEEAEKKVTSDLLVRELRIDTEIPFDLIDFKLYEEVQILYPFGIGNPEPSFVTRKVIVKKADIVGKKSDHIRLTLSHYGKALEAIGFGLARDFNSKVGDEIDIAYTIDINEWKGNKKINLKLKDLSC